MKEEKTGRRPTPRTLRTIDFGRLVLEVDEFVREGAYSSFSEGVRALVREALTARRGAAEAPPAQV